MDDKRTDNLLDQYEDALMALLMNEYAELNGARLLEEYEEAERSGAISEVPEALDRKCRDMIHRAYAKQRSRMRFKSFVKASKRVAVIALAVLGLCTVLVISVEAFRTPIVNFFIEQHEKYSTIDFGKDGNTTTSDATGQATGSQSVDRSEDPLAGMVPDGYILTQFSNKGKRGFTCYYEDGAGDVISFIATPAEGLLTVDTEDATVTDIELLDHKGKLIEKGGCKILWFDANVSICYQIRTTGLEPGETWVLAETIAKCPEWAELISGG